MKTFLDIKYNQYAALDVYAPEGKSCPVFIYFHGGGLEHGDKAEQCIRENAESFVKAGYVFVSVNYRMYGEEGVKFPDYLEDAADAVAFVGKNAAAWGGNGDLYVSGSSAGAWLSVMLCLSDKYLANVGVDRMKIKGWVIDSSQMTSHFNVQKMENGVDARLQRIDSFAPLYFVDSNMKFSRMLLLFYENDMACRVEQNMLFYKAVLYFDPNADISYRLLKGKHCAGISQKDEDGEYPYAKETLAWLKAGENGANE